MKMMVKQILSLTVQLKLRTSKKTQHPCLFLKLFDTVTSSKKNFPEKPHFGSSSGQSKSFPKNVPLQKQIIITSILTCLFILETVLYQHSFMQKIMKVPYLEF